MLWWFLLEYCNICIYISIFKPLCDDPSCFCLCLSYMIYIIVVYNDSSISNKRSGSSRRTSANLSEMSDSEDVCIFYLQCRVSITHYCNLKQSVYNIYNQWFEIYRWHHAAESRNENTSQHFMVSGEFNRNGATRCIAHCNAETTVPISIIIYYYDCWL